MTGQPVRPGLSDLRREDYQQYLAKHPYGYRSHANTGEPFPSDA
jgi:hypothetical protein